MTAWRQELYTAGMAKKKATYDVLVVGAGAAGLACAHELSLSAIDFLLLEARPRTGGRILTVTPPNWEGPVELGAEFIHGAQPEILTLMKKFNLPFIDGDDNHLLYRDGKLGPLTDFFAQLEKFMPSKDDKDQTVASYLKRKKISAKWHDQFRAFVEGFHAADLNIIGTRALAAAMETDEEGLNGSNMFRPVTGYKRLTDNLARTLAPERIRMNTVVKRIRWKKHEVELACESPLSGERFTLTSKRLVITLPIGVLKNGSLKWDPEPTGLSEALDAMEMGHVQRLVIRFRERFWESLSHDKPIAFLHSSPQNHFPTWWTQAPLRSHNLVAWQGGPKAQEMANWTSKEILAEALATIAKICGRSSADLAEIVDGFRHHNWSNDPFSCGGYSYVGTGAHAKNILTAFKNTVYFAGEGTCFDASRGTVHGALSSGRRVARLLE